MKRIMLFVVILITAVVSAQADDHVGPFFGEDGVAIKGYDAVAYFVDGEPVPGDAAIATEWGGATWHFASSEHRDLFVADPEAYAPQYGGYCAFAAARNYIASIDPTAWTVVDDRLYLNFSRGVRRQWQRDTDGNITRADANWPGLRETVTP